MRLFTTPRRQARSDFGLPVRWHSVYGPSLGLGTLRRSVRRIRSAWSKGARSVRLVAILLLGSGLLLTLALLWSTGTIIASHR